MLELEAFLFHSPYDFVFPVRADEFSVIQWWDNLWLNESFATLMGEVIVIDELEPSWKIHSSFISEHLSRALDLDSLRSSHPIEMPCPDEATINQIFDAVSYSKGGSVLKVRLLSQRTSLPKSKLT